MVREPVEQRGSQHGIVVEDTGPLFVNPVGGDQCGATFIAMADDLEQAVCAKLVDGQIAQFVDAQHTRFDVMLQGALHTATGVCQSQGIDDLDSPGGWRQLPCPVDDNYPGRLGATTGRLWEVGLS